MGVCPSIKAELKQSADNPKRRQRSIKKQLQNIGVGTKSQQALAAQREELKAERKNNSKEHRDAEKQRHYELKQQKRKEKYRGH